MPALPPPKKKIGLPPPKKPAPSVPSRKLYRVATQDTLFEVETKAEAEWQGMPEFKSEKIMPFHTVYVHFETIEDIKNFSKAIGIKINTEIKEVKYTPRLWFPGRENLKVAGLRYKSK